MDVVNEALETFPAEDVKLFWKEAGSVKRGQTGAAARGGPRLSVRPKKYRGGKSDMGGVSGRFSFCASDLPLVLGRTLCYGWYCWSIERTVSPWTTIQTPLSSGSNNFSLLVPLTMAASWDTVIGVPVGAFVITVTCVSAGTL
jgi:hypothetical protein